MSEAATRIGGIVDWLRTSLPPPAGYVVVFSLIIAMLVLTSCSTQPPDRRSDHKRNMDLQLEQSSQRSDESAYQQINRALSYYKQIDDRPGQWQANISLANWHIAQHEKIKALPFARRALGLAEKLNDRSMKFTSSIQLGLLTEAPPLYLQALNNAQTDLQRALALTFLKRYEEAKKIFPRPHSDQNPDELGFLYYHYGKHRKELPYVLLALDNYRNADYVYGVIDSLFLAAQLAEKPATASDFAERALLAAESAKDEMRTRAIQAWINMHIKGIK